ncbi:MAG: type II secretion system F family protein [Planctomycetes bacterium]|nr:type II secretion system F family protein [Planctomycetota bacterium]
MTSHLSTALNAGLPLLNAIEIVGAQQHKKPMKELMDSLVASVNGGNSFSDALEEHPNTFSRLYVSMVRVGETGGILEKTMSQLTQLLSREVKIKSNMAGAMIYPMVVLALGMVSVVVMVIAVVPKIIQTLGEDAALPWATQSLLDLSDLLKSYGLYAAVFIIVAAIMFVKWKKTPEGRLKMDGFLLRIPILGKVLTTIAVGRFARTLGALTSSGITILHALSVVRDTLGNEFLGRLIDDVSEKVRMGHSLAKPLASSAHFPPLLIQIVSVGEQTGKLDELLLNAADTFDDEADSAVERFMTLFPVLLIIILALIIGYIIAATLLPIITLDLTGIGL